MKILHRLSLFLAFLFLAPLGQLSAAVGSDNPTGVFGIFNGNVTTGCSYDPYTGNAMRSIPDISVAGAVGSYGLALSRTYNSRNGIGFSYGFSGWRHSYEWTMDDSPITHTQNYPPSSYSVNFPDGRNEIFASSPPDIYYRAGAGIRERFQPISGNYAYLILPDGGKVKFLATQLSQYDGELHQWSYWYTYVAQAIIDPYGQTTTFTYNPDGTLQKVTEPAGRTLQFYYITVGSNRVLDHVTGTDGRIVQYYYIQSAFSPGTTVYVVLDHVVYYSDSTWTARYKYRAPNTGGANGIPLLWTCDDPMYPGPMRRIGYTYHGSTPNNPDGSAPVYGQISSENYYDGTNVGAAVSSLSISTATTRTETRADLHTRTFTYTSAMLTRATDFSAVAASQTYDTNGYINSVTDRNSHTTNFTCNAFTGLMTQVQYPLTQGDTPGQTQRPTVNYTYGSASCFDANNRDANNPYYVCTATDEGGQITKFTRDGTSKRVIRIDYPDTGYETFVYNSFGEVTSHRMTTGGTETFSYDTRGLKTTYCDPYHASGNPPSAWYQYNSFDWVSVVTDALGSALGDLYHTTSYGYNRRGQVTIATFPIDPIDGNRRSIGHSYNPDGTVATASNQLSQVTSYTYDDYRRLRSVTTPQRFTGDTTLRTTYSYYDASGSNEDYTHTDSNVTHLVTPSGSVTTTTYDPNYRKTSVAITAADGHTDWAKTSYGYDNEGNLTSVIAPNEQPGQIYAGKSTVSAYDERNRLMSVTDALDNDTTFTYDTAGRKKIVTRANGQVITYDYFDAMNRLLQQTAYQNPSPPATTKYTYYTSGLLHTMQDPHLVAITSTDNYSYAYDQMGRKWSVTYPAETGGAHRVEYFTYDTAGRLSTFVNRSVKTQTFTYDALNRLTGFSWNDGLTPSVTFGYDVGSRLRSVTNVNATIARNYFNDNLLSSETTTYPAPDNRARTVTYSYDADGNRATIQYPGNVYSFTYDYTARRELRTIVDNNSATIATYWYDLNSNIRQRAPNNATVSTYAYDALDRVTNVTHSLNGDTRTLDYAYDSAGNRKWTKRDGGTGDVFGYDFSDQVTAVKLDVANPDTTSVSQNISYDANGNRISFAPYGTTDTYTTNNLNQYTQRNAAPATYDPTGNLKNAVDASVYTYDAQNRLLTATKSGTTETFKYDGLNRQVSRTIGAGAPTYNVYDGWELIGEYAAGATTPTVAYVSGAGGLVKNLTTNRYYYQDASGSTSHLADSTGHLLEWYRYDLQGTPFVYDASNTQIPSSNYGIRHLFTGQQWYSEIGLYDLRNRYYSPDIGRFLQPDPIGFNGDATNLYRYCGNNPVRHADPSGEFCYITYPGGNNIVIYVPIAYTNGPGISSSYGSSLASYMNDSISGAWTGNYGGFNVKTIAYTASPYEYANQVTFVAGTFQSEVKDGHVIDMAVPGQWDYSQLGYYFAHEGGHFMGALDTSRADDPCDIMATFQDGATPNDRDLQTILRSGGHGAGGNAPSGYAPGSYGFVWGQAPWLYGQGPGWGSAGNFNWRLQQEQDLQQSLAWASQDVTWSGPGEPSDFEGRRGPQGSWAAIMSRGQPGAAQGSWPVRGR